MNTLRICLAVLLLASAEVHAQAWPAKPVRMVTPIAPGGAADIVARIVAERLTKALGQSFVVENLPGASGVVGAQAVARAAPDGYTIFFAPSSPLVSAQFTMKSLPYDPVRDFTPVGTIVYSGPTVISVHPGVPASTLAELIALAKAQPGKLSYSVDVSSGLSVNVGRLFTKLAEVQIVEIAYKSTSQSVMDAVAGVVQVHVGSVASARTFANAGKLRRLAISSEKRFPGLEDLPTIAETVPGAILDGFYVMVAPAGTPDPIVQRLNRELDMILTDASVAAKLLDFGLATAGAGTPQSTGEYLRVERERWREVTRMLGMEPQ
jgi:tripartite-type tricarboxylate transporter receptor subunit TctC